MASHLKLRHKILKNQQTVQGKRQLTLQESVNMIPTIVSLIIFIILILLQNTSGVHHQCHVIYIYI